MMAFAARYVLPLLAMGITIPLWVIMAVALWAHFDKGSAVRTAVDRAVTQLVAGAEIEAAKAIADAERRLRLVAEGAAAEARRRATAAEDANRSFAAALAATEADMENLSNDLDDLLSQPVDERCTVSPDLLERMRNR